MSPKRTTDTLTLPTVREAVVMDLVRHRDGERPEVGSDKLAVEEPLEIRVRGRSIAVTMRTPGQDPELVAGFLLTEGIIHRAGDIVEIAPCLAGGEPDNTLNVFLAPKVEVDFDQLTRHVFASSSCGLCGKASIEALSTRCQPLTGVSLSVAPRAVTRLPTLLREAQPVFAHNRYSL